MQVPGEIISLVQDDGPQQRIQGILLPAAHALAGTINNQPTGSKHLEEVLRARLIDVKQMNLEFLTLTEPRLEAMDVDALQYLTGDTSMKIIEQISIEERRDVPFELSLADQSTLRMLAALVFRWKLSKETKEFNNSTSALRKQHLSRLSGATLSLLRIIFPEEQPKTDSTGIQNTIGTILLQDHTVEILPSTFSLGWLTPGECDDGPYIRTSTLRLLSSFGLGESMQLLGLTLNAPCLPATAKNAVKYLLSRRILHPKGVRALFGVILGEEQDESPLTKYEHLGTLLSTPPRGTSAEVYFGIVVPQILDILLREPSSSRMPQAASHILSVLLSTRTTSPTVSPLIFNNIFGGFRDSRQATQGVGYDQTASYTPHESVEILSKFFTMAPPTADDPLIATILEPTIEKLYSLLYYLETRAISDPTETEKCKGLLVSWMKVVPAETATKRLWAVIEGKGGEWFMGDGVNNEGLVLRWRHDILLQNIKIADLGDLEKDAMHANSLNLRPDPIHLVGLLKDIGRKEVASLLFIRILADDGGHDIEPTRGLLRMQILYQMQHQLPSSILRSPSHALAFVDHVMNTASLQISATRPETSLRFVKDEDDDESESHSGDLLDTAVEFLLSSLEASPGFVPLADDPHVQRVTKKLKQLSLHPSVALRQASREASLVLTARLSAAAVTQSDHGNEGDRNSQEKYQESLILLQDPLLPVRAQGLAMLRHLIESDAYSKESTSSVKAALRPAILDIFVNSAQNEDSFIFLNAVKGLVAMVQTFGRDVFKRLLEIYATEPLSAGNMNRQELDMKLRIGEALGEVIGTCGQSLGGYVDILMPVILATIRDQSMPTTLRTSAISLASKCVETAPLAMSAYSPELSGAMLDLLELEHTVQVEPRDRQRQRIGGSGSELSKATCGTEKEERGAHNRRQGEPGDLETDSDPVGINAKLSPLRRSAIHLLGAIILQFLRTVREGVHGGGGDGAGLRGFPVRRAATVLRYLSVHDVDAVVNVMATEVVALLGEVGRARLGLD